MAVAILTWLVAIPVLGGMTGLRTMTPMAVLCWFAYRGNLSLDGTWAQWAAKPVTLIVFMVLAVGELIGDKLPQTPARTTPFALVARVCFGALVGALAATGLAKSALEGAILAAASALAAAFLGYHWRRDLVREQGYPDFGIALVEDVLAIGLSILAMGIVTG